MANEERDSTYTVFAYRDSPTAPLTLVIAPGEELAPGDLIMLDPETGKVRKYREGVDTERAYTVPPGSRVTEDGNLEMPQ